MKQFKQIINQNKYERNIIINEESMKKENQKLQHRSIDIEQTDAENMNREIKYRTKQDNSFKNPMKYKMNMICLKQENYDVQ